MPDTDADNEADSPGWVPDQRTIDWCFGALYYKNLIAPLRDTARGRYEAGEDFDWNADDPGFWAIVGESAEEAVLYELHRLAAEASEPSSND